MATEPFANTPNATPKRSYVKKYHLRRGIPFVFLRHFRQTHLRNMNILLVIQHPGSVDSGHSDLIPLHVVHVILVDPELGAGQGDAGHLVLKGRYVEGSRDHVVEQELAKNTMLNAFLYSVIRKLRYC